MSDDTEKTSGAAHQDGGAARRQEIGDTGHDKEQSGRTGAGQEANHGVAPGQHDREHQSNYGGGGANGGADGDKR